MRILILYHPGTNRPEAESFGDFIGGCTSTCGTKKIYFDVVNNVNQYVNAHSKNPFTHVFAHLKAEQWLADHFPGNAVVRKTYTSNRKPLYVNVFHAVKSSSQTNNVDIFIDSVITEFRKFLTSSFLEIACDNLARFDRLFQDYSHSAILTKIFSNLESHESQYADYLEKNYASTDDANRDYVRDIIKYYDSLSDAMPRKIDSSEVISVESSDVQLGMANDEHGSSKLGIVGDSPQIKAIREMIRSITLTQNRVLILGETGTGKEKVAEAFHLLAGAEAPFIAEACTKIGDINIEKRYYFGQDKGFLEKNSPAHVGLLEQAAGGILFLDEIQEISLEIQSMLKRVLEPATPPYTFVRQGGSTCSICARILFATNQMFDALVSENKLQNDFANRIDQSRINVPPLRERRLDIPVLVKYLCAQIPNRTIQGFTSTAMIALMTNDWPNNVRGLRNIVSALNAKGKSYIDHCDLPSELISSTISSVSGSILTSPPSTAQEKTESYCKIVSQPMQPDLVFLQLESKCKEYNRHWINGGQTNAGAEIEYNRVHHMDKTKEVKQPGSNFRRKVSDLKKKIKQKFNETNDDRYTQLLIDYPAIDRPKDCPQKGNRPNKCKQVKDE